MAYERPYRYPDGEPIPASLPERYQPASNPGVPTGQRCDNCGVYQADKKYCTLFKAPVRPYYWCARWIKNGET